MVDGDTTSPAMATPIRPRRNGQFSLVSMVKASVPPCHKPSRTIWRPWLTAVQQPDGSACYQAGIGPCDHADTGGLLLGLDFLGKSASDPAVQKALAFLDGNWTATANGTWYGNIAHPYAMWAEYKGLDLTIGLADALDHHGFLYRKLRWRFTYSVQLVAGL